MYRIISVCVFLSMYIILLLYVLLFVAVSSVSDLVCAVCCVFRSLLCIYVG